MSLVYTSVALNMTNVYNTLKTDTISVGDQVPHPKAPLTQWMDGFKLHYNANSIAGTFSEANVVMVGMPALLGFNNISNIVCASAGSVGDNMANAIAAYWSAQITPGAPQHKSRIVSISNDAGKIAAPIKDYICSQTSTLKTPSYEHLFQFIENQVKTIVWSVTETNEITPTTYPVTIS